MACNTTINCSSFSFIIRVSVVLKRTVGHTHWRFDNLNVNHLQSYCHMVPSVDGIYVSIWNAMTALWSVFLSVSVSLLCAVLFYLYAVSISVYVVILSLCAVLIARYAVLNSLYAVLYSYGDFSHYMRCLFLYVLWLIHYTRCFFWLYSRSFVVVWFKMRSMT